MDVTVPHAALTTALRTVARAVPTKFSLPVLRSVLLESQPGRLTLRATDLDLGVVTSVAADVAAPGRVAVPARLLAEYVAQLPGDPVRLGLDAATHRVRASCSRFSASLATADPDDFPELPAVGDGSVLSLRASALHAAIDRVVFATARDDTRPVFRAVQFDCATDGLTLAAANGFRLARSRIPARGDAEARLLVPSRAVAELGRVLANAGEAHLTFRQDARQVRLVVGETTVIAQLAEGTFPDLEPVLSQPWTTRVAVEATAFRQAIRVASLFGAAGAGGDARPVVLDATPGRLRLSARGDETGDAETELPAAVEGDAQATVVNTRLLADVADAATAPWLELAWRTATTPLAIRERRSVEGPTRSGHGEPDTRDVWVVMPLITPAPVRAPAASKQADEAPTASEVPAAA